MDPFSFQWHLSDRCNLRCRHCYQEDHSAARERDASFWIELLEHIRLGLAEGEGLSINLTGGEPLLLEGLPFLLEALDHSPDVQELQIITNGTVIEGSVFESLGRCRKLTAIKISVEAGQAELNDAVRGAGMFRRVEENLEHFRKLKRPLVAMVTLGEHNLHGLDSFWLWVCDQGLDGLLLERFVPLGAGRHLAPGPIDEAAWQSAMRRLAQSAGLDIDPRELEWVRAVWIKRAADGGIEFCGAACELGGGSMALMPDGSVYSCRRLPRVLGRMPEMSFAEIRKGLMSFSPLKGGCRALDEAIRR